MMRSADPEIDAMAQCLSVLLNLDTQARARVMEYLDARLIDSPHPMPGPPTFEPDVGQAVGEQPDRTYVIAPWRKP